MQTRLTGLFLEQMESDHDLGRKSKDQSQPSWKYLEDVMVILVKEIVNQMVAALSDKVGFISGFAVQHTQGGHS